MRGPHSIPGRTNACHGGLGGIVVLTLASFLSLSAATFAEEEGGLDSEFPKMSLDQDPKPPAPAAKEEEPSLPWRPFELMLGGIYSSVTSTVTLGNTSTSTSLTTAQCPTPAVGTAEVCVAPAQDSTAGSYSSCTTAKTGLNHDPEPGDLGARKQEWTSPQYQSGRCFLIEVTVKYAFQPWTPVISQLIGSNITMVASTSMVAEY